MCIGGISSDSREVSGYKDHSSEKFAMSRGIDETLMLTTTVNSGNILSAFQNMSYRVQKSQIN